MARKTDIGKIEEQLEAAQAEAVKAKHAYDTKMKKVKELQIKKEEAMCQEIMTALSGSKRSYSEILKFIRSEPYAED